MGVKNKADDTAKLKEEISKRLSDGESLKSICKDGWMPGRSTVMEWLQKDEEFRTKCARARETAVEGMVEEILTIADDVDECPKSRGVRISARQWIAAKLMPKKYGDKVTHDLGADTQDALAGLLERVIK